MRGMRLRFTIRDLLWLALVVAIAIVWMLDRQSIIRNDQAVIKQLYDNWTHQADTTQRARDELVKELVKHGEAPRKIP